MQGQSAELVRSLRNELSKYKHENEELRSELEEVTHLYVKAKTKAQSSMDTISSMKSSSNFGAALSNRMSNIDRIIEKAVAKNNTKWEAKVAELKKQIDKF